MAAATHEGCEASDQVERPVRFGGIVWRVVEAIGEDRVRIEHEGREVEIALMDCQPCCAHCHGELEAHEDWGPGVCRNPECFLYVEAPY